MYFIFQLNKITTTEENNDRISRNECYEHDIIIKIHRVDSNTIFNIIYTVKLMISVHTDITVAALANIYCRHRKVKYLQNKK